MIVFFRLVYKKVLHKFTSIAKRNRSRKSIFLPKLLNSECSSTLLELRATLNESKHLA
jgi:hypothetical protein